MCTNSVSAFPDIPMGQDMALNSKSDLKTISKNATVKINVFGTSAREDASAYYCSPPERPRPRHDFSQARQTEHDKAASEGQSEGGYNGSTAHKRDSKAQSHGALSSLVPALSNPALLKSRSSAASASGLFQDEVDTFPHSQHYYEGRPDSEGVGRRQAKRKPTTAEDTDYEPCSKTQRPRKAHISSGSRSKSLGRSRLTLAGTASTIGDVDPGWSLPNGPVVLVAKALTKSDTLGRVILPRIAVETNMSFLTSYRPALSMLASKGNTNSAISLPTRKPSENQYSYCQAYTLAVKDLDDRPWEFVVKSWANGSEQRRVYVLEQASMFLRVNHLHEGDVIGICCDEAGNLQVAANTAALSDALARPNYSLNFARPMPKPVPGKNIPLATSHMGHCTRTPHCEKPQSHSGFCSGPRDKRRPSAAAAACELRDKGARHAGTSRNAESPLQTVRTFPLTADDLKQGQARLSTSAVQGWEHYLTDTSIAKDTSFHEWPVDASLQDEGSLCLLRGLSNYFQSSVLQEGDCLSVSSQKDGSILLQTESVLRRESSGQVLDQDLAQTIYCGPLPAYPSIQEGGIGMQGSTAVRLHPNGASHVWETSAKPLESENGVAPAPQPQSQGFAQPQTWSPHRRRRSSSKSSLLLRRSNESGYGSAFTQYSALEPEDSIAAEILVSMGESGRRSDSGRRDRRLMCASETGGQAAEGRASYDLASDFLDGTFARQ